MINYNKIYVYATKYRYRTSNINVWETLFDFIHKVGLGNIYRISNKPLFYQYFGSYMGSFGMFRGKNPLTQEKLEKILTQGKKEFLAYLLNPNETTFVIAWKKCYKLLKKINHKNPTPVFITKILMGFGGRTPAYDSRFLSTIDNHPLLLNIGINQLIKGISKYKPLKTPNGNIIPWERVLDMAFWSIDKASETKKIWLS